MRWILIVFVTALPVPLFCGSVVLENSTIKAVFNENTGALQQLISKKDGWYLQKRPELGRSFRLDIPLSHQRFNPVFGEEQPPPQIRHEKNGKRLRFQWKNVRSKNGGRLAVDFTGVAELTDDGLIFTAEIDNRSFHTVETVHWPILGDLSRPQPDALFSQLGMDYGGMKSLQLFPKFDNMPGYFAVDYPTQMLQTPDTPFSLITAPARGLYVGYHDTTAAHLVQFMARLKPGYLGYEFWDSGENPKGDSLAGQPVHLEFSVLHFPFFNGGESGKLQPVVLVPFQGSWHRGADIYKKWRQSWFQSPAKPDWLQQVHAWQQIHVNNPENDVRYSYRDLLKIGADCARHNVGALQITGWTIGGQDGAYPSHDTDPHLGTRTNFAEVIAQIQKMGVKVILFNKYTWADRVSPWYESELIRYTTKDPYGDPHYYGGYAYQTPTQLAEINTHRFSPLCHLSPAWRQVACGEFLKSIELGADGMLYDENQHHGDSRYCFDATHKHHVPAHIYAGDTRLATDFHEISNPKKADYLFAGEGNYDLQFREYHLSYFRVDLNHVALHRYVAPYQEMMIPVSGYNDRNMINLALMNRYIISYEPRNFKGRLDEFPQTIEYGKKVDRLREKLSAYLWHGVFQDTLGATVLSDGKIYTNYSVFIDPNCGKKAVVVVNYSYELPVEVGIGFADKTKKWTVATPENPVPLVFSGIVNIPVNSAVVVIEK
ncbi:MAG: hypothetical protein DWQ05_01880 [Calditrichaeota bacterium]|nr:MAG: hypothetical protein DWQ05_01880 [Calditrichota bacterium]